MEQDNPYEGWEYLKLCDELVENEAEWIDHCNRQSELYYIGDSIQQHRTWILQAIQNHLRPNEHES